MDIIVASSNKGKLNEIKQIFAGHNVISMAEAGCALEIEETGTTFLQNALIKAKALFDKLGRPTLSDDSGLAVNALNGEPGVYSARYSTLSKQPSKVVVGTTGPSNTIDQTNTDPNNECAREDRARSAHGKSQDQLNNELLLANLEHESDRRAKFVSVVVLYYAKDRYIWAEGEVEGEILRQERGSEGFGYDPLFYSTELQKTFAEATMAQKNTVSHRARALKALNEKIKSLNI